MKKITSEEASATVRNYSLSLFLVMLSVGVFYTILGLSPYLSKLRLLATNVIPAVYEESQAIPGTGIKVADLKIKYRSGELLYRGRILPEKGFTLKHVSCLFTGKDKSIFSSKNTYHVTLRFIDNDGFLVTYASISENDLSKVVGSNGKPIYYEFQGSVPISALLYKQIKNYSLSWNLSDSCK